MRRGLQVSGLVGEGRGKGVRKPVEEASGGRSSTCGDRMKLGTLWSSVDWIDLRASEAASAAPIGKPERPEGTML